MSKITLRKWQEAVFDWFDEYEGYADSQSMQSLQQYEINSLSSLNIKMPKGYGHTFLTAYLSAMIPLSQSKSPVVVVYFNMDHLKEIERYKTDVEHSGQIILESKQPIYISVYEFYYAINENVHSQNSSNIINLKSKINGNIIVVDRASSLPNTVRDFILSVATNAIVFLG